MYLLNKLWLYLVLLQKYIVISSLYRMVCWNANLFWYNDWYNDWYRDCYFNNCDSQEIDDLKFIIFKHIDIGLYGTYVQIGLIRHE